MLVIIKEKSIGKILLINTAAFFMQRFKNDLEMMYNKLSKGAPPRVTSSLRRIMDKLVKMYESRLVKINHSVMELVTAKYMLMKGYEVDIEHPIAEGLVCDIYCIRDGEVSIVEVETGFVPPENATDPVTYRRARIISKIARYSIHADTFGLATPIYHILQIPPLLLLPPEERLLYSEELSSFKKLCDRYYRNPPIGLKELMKCKINFILMVNVDEGMVIELEAKDYVRWLMNKTLELIG